MGNEASADSGLSPARVAAIEQLNRIEVGGAYIGTGPEAGLSDAREERLAKEYVAGITRWRRWLDFLLAAFYRGDYGRMEPLLRQILRLGLYDLLFLDTPPHAALHEAVELAKRKVRPGAAGLVNGILRSIQRQEDDLPTPSTGDEAEDLAVRFSHPTWMVRRWLKRFGEEETGVLLRWNNARPVYGVRANPLKKTPGALEALLDELEVEWQASPYVDGFVRVQRLQPLFRTDWLEQGWCSVQDESAGLIVQLLDPRPDETIVDGCAAPGGKAVYAAERMRNSGHLLAFDVDEGRLARVRQAAEQHGVAGIVEAQAADLREVAGRGLRADRVLVDVPCSGLGVLSKRADLRWQRKREDLEELVALEEELLQAAARLVRPGGILVYSTCTIEPEENDEVVERFLERRPSFSLEAADGLVPAPVVTTQGYLATLPHRHGVDGAFGARLRRVT